jgi:hypothetical protein
MGDHPPEPLPAKHAAATSISNESGEKPMFVAEADALKSWSRDVPLANFLRSTA